ncbi:EamA family transporter [Shewanella sp. SR44-3]|uniref:EamA family transporter n=1 Tax=Shewanella sp. SR44-3 TaxID=2760936 RepID=UPI0015FA362B|nr:EamA family transporter [Shewanella sp. SR44-3]MBB1270862.1 EamA family transporter [Shewanella sp. SR44-3]
MKTSSLWFNLLLTCLAPLVWGSTYIVTTQMLPADLPLLASTLRALPAGLLLLMIYRKMPTGQWWLKIALLGMLNIGVFFYCLFSAAYYLPGGTAAVIMSCQPLLVMGLSAILFKEKVTLANMTILGLGVLGIVLLVLQGNVVLNWQGVAFGLAGAASMALGLVLTKYWGKPSNFSLIDFTGWQLTFGGMVLLPITLYLEGFPPNLTELNIVGYSYLCIIGSVFGYMIWFRGIAHLPVVTSSFLGFLSPISAGVLGYFILDEQLTSTQWLGVIAIILAIVLTQLLNLKRQPPASKPNLNDIQAKTLTNA